MIETIKVSFPEVLEACLNKTKTTTIRKAWDFQPIFVHNCRNFDPPDCYCQRNEEDEKPSCKGFGCDPTYHANSTIEKPCKYKVGKEYDLVWSGANFLIESNKLVATDTLFSFGRVKVTKIEKIRIQKIENDTYYDLGYVMFNRFGGLFKPTIDKISKSEGFKDAKTMFKKIEEYADGLEVPKPFWLVTKRWL